MTLPAEHGTSQIKLQRRQSGDVPAHCEDAPKNHQTSESADPVIAAIQSAIGLRQFEHWLANRSRFDLSDDTLRVFVANPFIANWLLKRFRTSFNKAAAELLGPSGKCEVAVDEALQEATANTKSSRRRRTDPSSESSAPTAQSEKAPTNVLSPDADVRKLALPASNRRRFQTFATLVAGECNDLATMAARQVSEFPGERFNPLYIHGPTGVGKTHLLEAIYCETKRRHSNLNVLYISCEAFTNYFTQALESKTVPSFRQRFRNVNVLLVDNIEFLDNKRATQEEFLHTVVQVIEHGGQIVVTGDRHPRLLTKHREELTTRFLSGLVCRVDPPCEETRLRIASSLALPQKDNFTREALEYVARKCRKNVREIQGALNCLHGHFTLDQRRITASRAREILGDMQQECRRLVRLSDVEKVICDAFGLNASELRSKTRRKAISCPRSLAMFVARKLTKLAYREIGLYFGGRDHSTVVAAEKRVQKWVDDESPLELPSSCHGRTIAEVLQEIEERLLSLAS